ncbi:MAG: type II toxin-antitoxin system VapC family toxin [Ardenticatenaceae bacterium]|nr:type II toxin-antitoxin system VapC family toxin [Ardenticatenaceae bacterium]
MKLLLDTHIFLWYVSGDGRLPIDFQQVISDPDNEVYLSVASLWEIVVKYQIGKLPLPHAPEIYLPAQRQKHLINSLPLDEQSVMKLTSLPAVHRDPFDRMLVCQALAHDLTIVTVDDAMKAYPVEFIT